MLLHPKDTNQQDYEHAVKGMDYFHRSAYLYAFLDLFVVNKIGYKSEIETVLV